MNISSKQCIVGSLGAFDLTIPLIEISSGVPGPRIMFVANQHGNEITPLFVLKELLELLDNFPLKNGSVAIISTANPLGLTFGTRQEPLDGKNLNRSFPGSMQQDLGKRIAACVFEEVKNADLVVDLHTFSRTCPFMGILIKSGDAIEEACALALRAIAPECIWQIDMGRDEDKQFDGALDFTLIQAGTPAIAFEMPCHLTVAPEMISRIADSLFQLLASYGMAGDWLEKISQKKIPMFVIHYLFSDESGIFIPSKKIFDEVQIGDALGHVTDIRTFAQKPVSTPVAGTVLTLRYRDFLRSGSRLASIGEQKGVL